MNRIAISQAAFEAIARTLPLGNVSFENKIDENGDRLIWLEPNVVDRPRSLRGPGRAIPMSSCGWRWRAEGSSAPGRPSKPQLAQEPD